MKHLSEYIIESLQESIRKAIEHYGEDEKQIYLAVKQYSESKLGDTAALDLSKKDNPNYSICKNEQLIDYSMHFYNQSDNLSAIQICMLVRVFFENENGLMTEECEARTSFVENGKKMSEMNWYKDSILVFVCDNNDNAQYLEECLAAMGIWTSKGSGRQSKENSKFVFVTKKTKEELEFRAAVDKEWKEKLIMEEFNRYIKENQHN